MFKHVVVALVVSVALIGTSRAFWQAPNPGRSTLNIELRGGAGGIGFFGGSSATVSLLRTREVQSELKLDEAQTKKLDELNAETTRERSRLIAELNAKLSDLNKKADADSLALLNDAQRRRTEQLRLQQQGLRVLTSYAVAEKLGLTKAQRDEIAKLTQPTSRFSTDRDRTATPRDPNLPTRDRFQQARDEATKHAAETREKVLAVLTPDQKTKWSELTGEPFQFPTRSRSSTDRTGTRSPEPAKADTEKKDQ